MPGLVAEAVTKRFGGVNALVDVELQVERGEIVGLIGPNGSGKTTLLNVMSGVYRADAGKVWLGELDLTHRATHEIASLGVARTFQNIRLFENLSALENVQVGASATRRRDDPDPRTTAWRLLERLGLEKLAQAHPRSLPYGVQRRVEIARALAARPQHLLLDEPAAGMNDAESEGLLASIRAMRDEYEMGLVVIDHDLRLITMLCDRAVVLNSGRVIAAGPPNAVMRQPEVIEAYLGKKAREGTDGEPRVLE